jgi:hypothetical protein
MLRTFSAPLNILALTVDLLRTIPSAAILGYLSLNGYQEYLGGYRFFSLKYSGPENNFPPFLSKAQLIDLVIHLWRYQY